MIPLRDKVRSRTTPIVIFVLIVLNALVFIYQLSLSQRQLIEFFYSNGIVPKFLEMSDAWQERGVIGQIWPFFASMFLHGGWLHIIGNMWTLFIFGDNVEDRMGLHAVTNWGSDIPAIGASGAIAGVMGAYLVYYPRAQIVTLLPIFFYFTIITVPAWVFLIVWFALQFFSGTFSLLEGGAGAGVAWWAHVGGFLFGLLTAKLFQKFNRPQIDVNVTSSRFYAD